MAKAKATTSRKEIDPAMKLPKILASLYLQENGKFGILCPECGRAPVPKAIDYDVTNDGKFIWFAYLCPDCRKLVVSFSTGKCEITDVKNLYDEKGRLRKGSHKMKAPQKKKETKSVKKVVKKHVLKKPIIPDLD